MLIMVTLPVRQLRESVRRFFDTTNVVPELVIFSGKQELKRNAQNDAEPERILQGRQPVAPLVLLNCGSVMVAHSPRDILKAEAHTPPVQFYLILVYVCVCLHWRVFVLKSL
jgi:hypothetical protein